MLCAVCGSLSWPNWFMWIARFFNIIQRACMYDLKKNHTNHEYQIGYVDCESLNIIRLACVYDLKKNHTNHEYRIGLCGLCGSYIIVWFLYLTHHLGESVEVVGTVYEFTAFVVEKEDGYFRDVVFQSVG